ncbi:hypothetical protein BCV69DRAFT_280853 [Microstroma glucosiphilum]|uniref:FAD-binding PCMH-type domain-containing protein n=1 Tax=Pseudomicrostroma glucosiphilum TaxID=1684307 RepID=A0A316UDG4_9BASI|nr:hypothetical protein BCV69DRAFT_280853 [Pseudomicrostroma glucosiphilum]PWN23246.1 hypothetical protein BCV69DRAFT_280853 [Pseudomicrostroma glucosiphilum]
MPSTSLRTRSQSPCKERRRTITISSLAFWLILGTSLLPLVHSVPNFLPSPEEQLVLPRGWERGTPPEDALSELTRRRYSHKHDHPGPSQLHQCLKTAGADWDLTSPFLNGTDNYWEAAQSDNLRFHYHPDAIVYPRSAHDVARAIHCARENGNVPVTARSGGHSFIGLGTGGEDGHLVVDLKYFNHVDVARNGKTANIGPAARLGDVILGLWGNRGELKKAIPHGTCPVVGVGGHALCGGFGPTSRKWGLTTDAFVEATVVLANSTIITVHRKDKENTPKGQLLKALRGTGAQFGIVTNFKFETHDASGRWTFLEYRWSPSIKSGDDIARIIAAVQGFATEPKSHLPRELGFHLQISRASPSDPPGGTVAVHLRGVYMGRKAFMKHSIMSHLFMRHIPKHGAPQPDSLREEEMSYLQIMEEWDDFGVPGNKLNTQLERTRRNNFLARTQLTVGQRGFSDKTLRNITHMLFDENLRHIGRSSSESDGLQQARWNWNVYMEMYGGPSPRHAAAELAHASSFPFRDGLWLIQSSVGTWGHQSLGPQAHRWLSLAEDHFQSALAADGIERRSFPCYADATLRKGEQWKHLYHGESIMRELEVTKRAVDPWNTFRSPMSIWGTQNRLPLGEKHRQEALQADKDKKAKLEKEKYAKLHPAMQMGKHHGATIKTTQTHVKGVKILHPLPRSLPWTGMGAVRLFICQVR